MQYQHFDAQNYEDFACGRVIYHKTGFPNFPVRLAGEIFLRCLQIRGKAQDKVVLYDPCCGGGYALTVLGFLCGDSIDAIYASDISAEAVALARENLGLLAPQGLARRKAQLLELQAQFGKNSHAAALESIARLQALANRNTPPPCTVFQADIMDEAALSQAQFQADIVFADLPYGNLASWSTQDPCAMDNLLRTLTPVLADHAVVALCSDKVQKLHNPR